MVEFAFYKFKKYPLTEIFLKFIVWRGVCRGGLFQEKRGFL